jgi:hypothetical protein
MMTENEKKQWELQAYGCTADALKYAIEENGDALMLAAGILSDAQEVISGEFGEPDTETARQYMNRAKYIIFKLMKDERNG